MKPIPQENFESNRPVRQRKNRPSSRSGRQLSPAQLQAKKLAKKLEIYALDSRPYSPSQINNLIEEVRGNVIRINIQRKHLNSRQSNRNSRRSKRQD